MITRAALKLNWEGTNRILRAAVRRAQAMGIPMSIAVVDEGSHLLGFARTDEGKIHNIRIAQVKAWMIGFLTGVKKKPDLTQRRNGRKEGPKAIAISLPLAIFASWCELSWVEPTRAVWRFAMLTRPEPR